MRALDTDPRTEPFRIPPRKYSEDGQKDYISSPSGIYQKGIGPTASRFATLMYRTEFPTWVIVVVMIVGTSIVPWLSIGAVHPAASDVGAETGVTGTDVDEWETTADIGSLTDGATHGADVEQPVSLSVDDHHDGSLEEHVLGSLQRFDLPVGMLIAGYSRYDDSDPLENDVRQRVYETVRRSPGTYPMELADTVDVSRSTVRYHVRILEDEGLISGEKIRGKQRYFPGESVDAELSAALRDDATGAVLDALERLEPVSVSRLASDLDRAPSTVSYHLDRLADAGLVEQERDQGAVLNRLSDGRDWSSASV